MHRAIDVLSDFNVLHSLYCKIYYTIRFSVKNGFKNTHLSHVDRKIKKLIKIKMGIFYINFSVIFLRLEFFSL